METNSFFVLPFFSEPLTGDNDCPASSVKLDMATTFAHSEFWQKFLYAGMQPQPLCFVTGNPHSGLNTAFLLSS